MKNRWIPYHEALLWEAMKEKFIQDNFKWNMEQNKYYTPDIEDLYVGYKCEIRQHYIGGEPHWVNKIIEVEENNITPEYINTYHTFRTKYLNKEDIESLGWKEYQPNKYEILINNPKWFGWDYRETPQTIYLSVDDHNYPQKITIHNGESYEDYSQWFDGECKSINELKKIMKWLKIN